MFTFAQPIQVCSSVMEKTKPMRDEVAEATAEAKERGAEDKLPEQRMEDNNKRERTKRSVDELKKYRVELQRKDGEVLTKKEVRLVR